MITLVRYYLHKSLVLLSIAALIVASAPFVQTSPVSAQEASGGCDQEFYSSNDILFYNPCATSCGGASGVSVAKVEKLRGKNNGEKIFNFWVDAGLTAQQAAGITGSIQHESGFSAFRQETTQTWPAGGWGIAQFTGGQRDAAVAFVKSSMSSEVFEKYYVDTYGGSVDEADGFIPEGIPADINDKFLLAELNYLLSYTKSYVPNSIRVSGLKTDYGQQISEDVTVYDYLKTVVRAEDVAIAWTYLYEYPANIKTTSAARGESAKNIMTLYSEGIKSTCGGGLMAGGMTLDQAKKFMEDYKSNPDNVQYIGGAGQDCVGGPLANCVSFSIYFVNKYTNIGGVKSGPTGNGSTVVANLISKNPDLKNGHSPQPYAIFSTPSGSMMCGDIKCGHTGVILGVNIADDPAKSTVIVGEAGCGSGASWTTAREYPLSRFDSDAYTYAYTDGLLKGDVK